MVAKLGLFIDGRWRSLRSLAAEGRALDFVVVRRGVHRKLARPPRRSRICAGLPLHYRRIKQSKDIYKQTDKNDIFIYKKRQQPLTEVEINNEYSKSSPLINDQNLKAYKCFPQSRLQKAYKSVPEHHNNDAKEKGIVIKDSSEDESPKFLGKENKDIPKKDTKNSDKLAQNASKHSISKRSNRNLKSTLIINDNDDKVTVNGKENVEKENISEDDFKVNQQPSKGKANNKSIELSVKSSNDKICNAEKKLENESSKIKDFYKNVQPSTSKGSNQNLLSKSSLRNDKLRNDEDSAAESESSGPCLELVVEPEDLDLMRQCLINEPVFKVDIDRFDKDELYRQKILYKLQPVVQVAYLKPGLHHQLSESSRRSGNVSSGSSLKKKTKSSTITDSKRRRSPVRFRKSSVKAGREYSSLEDHAIVSWLSASRSREHAVNGNRVWLELETQHAQVTGQDRSWQSLRNRYLRYILPALGRLALSPSHAQRLRAAAATGKIKSREKRRPSILLEPTVRTAHRRPYVRTSTVPSDTESDGNLHHKEQHKNKKASPSKKQRTDSQKDIAQASSDDGNLHHKEQHKNKKASTKKQRAEPQKDAAEDSSSEDGVLHHKVQRPSLRHNNMNASLSKKQRSVPQKDAAEDSSSDDGILHHKVQRPSLRSKNKNASPSKKRRSEPQKDAAEDSSSDDGILHHKVQRPSLRSKNKNASPSKKRRSEPQQYVYEESSNDDEAKLPKKTASKRPRESEDSDSDDAPLELSRLRPRPSLRFSSGSDDDKPYDPSPSKKKRRRLFNP